MTRALVSRPAVCPVEWIEVVLSAPVPLAVKSAIPISRSERIRAKALSAILAADLWTADAERNLVSTEARFLKKFPRQIRTDQYSKSLSVHSDKSI